MKNDRLIINYEIVFILSLHRSQSKKLYTVAITTNIVSSNTVHDEVYLMKFASDLRQVSGFFRFSPPTEMTIFICYKYVFLD
jgi:hypothetical protein